jgi:hypothetical protein
MAISVDLRPSTGNPIISTIQPPSGQIRRQGNHSQSVSQYYPQTDLALGGLAQRTFHPDLSTPTNNFNTAGKEFQENQGRCDRLTISDKDKFMGEWMFDWTESKDPGITVAPLPSELVLVSWPSLDFHVQLQRCTRSPRT